MPAPEPHPVPDHSGREIVSSRVFLHPRETLFEAFLNPDHLVRWWGPEGFTNTLEVFDPTPQGRWKVIMRGPDGTDYPSENVFIEIVKLERIVSRHLQPPDHNFTLTMQFIAESGRTRVTWHMLFESATECAKLRAVITHANQQNFDRLETFLKTLTTSAGS